MTDGGEFTSAAVIGTGMMGPGIALTLALGGLRTTILSRKLETATAAVDRARAQLDLLAREGLAGEQAAAEAGGLLEASADFDATVQAVDLVVESAPENLEFKQELFRRLDERSRPETVLASNTSGLSITAIQSGCGHPERVVTTHFWNPPHLMPLIEIVLGERTDPAVGGRLKSLLSRCGKVPVIVNKDTPGQLGNRLQIALVREAVHIVQEGIAGVEEVDLAAKMGFGLRLPVYGILEHQDMVGLDMTKGIVDYIAADLANTPGAPRLMGEMVARGDYGAKTGRGFYDWSVKDADAVKARRDAFLIDFLRRWR